VVKSPIDAMRASQLALLTVPDSAIHGVAESLAEGDLSGHTLAHTSGAVAVTALNPVRARGALTGGIHPILPIADSTHFPSGVTFGLEADREPLRGYLYGIVNALDGTPLWLRAGVDRVRYHAAAVLLSNYVVTLYAEAFALLMRGTVDESGAKSALLALGRAALDNLEAATSPAQALTGPLVRGDHAVVQAHWESLRKLDPELGDLYRKLGARTLKLAIARGLDGKSVAALRAILTESDSPTITTENT
jgi:predicted short-subunit dehydrogenase-like oxidoreductase (DUF2520 family)